MGEMKLEVNKEQEGEEKEGKKMMEMMGGRIKDVKGIKIGNNKMKRRKKGCRVMICEEGEKDGVDVRGQEKGKREKDMIEKINLVKKVKEIMI